MISGLNPDVKSLAALGFDQGGPRESEALAKDAAALLLTRSIQFGHGHLAVVRLAMAVHCGAEIPKEHWLYCHEVAMSSKDPSIHALFLEAMGAVSSSPDTPYLD